MQEITTRDKLQSNSLELKDPIPSDVRTPDKDTAAREISNWMDAGEWPKSATDMADEGAYSPQHYRNTIDGYFKISDDDSDESLEDLNGPVDVDSVENIPRSESELLDSIARDALNMDIPSDVEDREAWVRGWFTGRLASLRE